MTQPPTTDFGPFRIFPTPRAKQRFASERAACSECLGGTCCSSEDPICLTAFDVLRLATFFDLSPAEFLLRFTQDRFADDHNFDRRGYLDNPASSVITFLRRRANKRTSPCLFLKYIHDATGTPRRVCSVHDARPLACREYYYDTCKTRWTGELAAMQAHGLEMVRDGAITVADAEAKLTQPRSATMGGQLERSFWQEMLRALDIHTANHEGANSFDIRRWQDPIDAKLNRMLSTPGLRLEEKYGPEPWGEQLHAYSSGLAFRRSPDRARLLKLVEDKPRTSLFTAGDYPFYVASRFSMPGFRWPRFFPQLTPAARKRVIASLPEPQRAACQAALATADALTGFIAYSASRGDLLEMEPPGTLDREILFYLTALAKARHPIYAAHPGLAAAFAWIRTRAKLPAEWRKRLPAKVRTRSQVRVEALLNPPIAAMPATQADYWRGLLQSLTAHLLSFDWTRK